MRATTGLLPPTATRTITPTAMEVTTTLTQMGVHTIILEREVPGILPQAVDLDNLLGRPVGRVSEIERPLLQEM